MEYLQFFLPDILHSPAFRIGNANHNRQTVHQLRYGAGHNPVFLVFQEAMIWLADKSLRSCVFNSDVIDIHFVSPQVFFVAKPLDGFGYTLAKVILWCPIRMFFYLFRRAIEPEDFTFGGT